MSRRGTYYGAPYPLSTGPHPDPLAEVMACEHDWRERTDSQFSNEIETDVECTKCLVSGARNVKSGEVFWPAT